MQANTAGKQFITPSASPAPPSAPSSSKANYNAFASFSTPPPQKNSNAFANLNIRATPPVPSNSQPLHLLQQQLQQRSQGLARPTQASGEVDEWADFASALPPASNVPALKGNEVLVVSSNLHIIVATERESGSPDGAILLKARFSNASSQPIHEMTFQMAVPKVHIPPFLFHFIFILLSPSGAPVHQKLP